MTDRKRSSASCSARRAHGRSRIWKADKTCLYCGTDDASAHVRGFRCPNKCLSAAACFICYNQILGLCPVCQREAFNKLRNLRGDMVCVRDRLRSEIEKHVEFTRHLHPLSIQLLMASFWESLDQLRIIQNCRDFEDLDDVLQKHFMSYAARHTGNAVLDWPKALCHHVTKVIDTTADERIRIYTQRPGLRSVTNARRLAKETFNRLIAMNTHYLFPAMNIVEFCFFMRQKL